MARDVESTSIRPDNCMSVRSMVFELPKCEIASNEEAIVSVDERFRAIL